MPLDVHMCACCTAPRNGRATQAPWCRQHPVHGSGLLLTMQRLVALQEASCALLERSCRWQEEHSVEACTTQGMGRGAQARCRSSTWRSMCVYGIGVTLRLRVSSRRRELRLASARACKHVSDWRGGVTGSVLRKMTASVALTVSSYSMSGTAPAHAIGEDAGAVLNIGDTDVGSLALLAAAGAVRAGVRGCGRSGPQAAPATACGTCAT